MSDLKWMQCLCDPLRADKSRLGVDIGEAEMVAHPWTIHIKHGPWYTVAATDTTMISVEGKGNHPEAPAWVKHRFMPHLVGCGGIPLDFEAFRKWCGTVWRSVVPCPACDGVWAKVCPSCWGAGSKKDRCACGHEHECPCGHCQEQGLVYCPRCMGGEAPKVDHGVINGVVFNRSQLAMALAQVSASEILMTSGGPNDPLRLMDRSETWHLVVSPLKIKPQSNHPVWRRPEPVEAAS